MALPTGAAAKLTAGMAKTGMVSPMASEDDPEPAAAEDDGGVDAIIADIDELVPGLGKLVHELVDRLKADDEESDAAEA